MLFSPFWRVKKQGLNPLHLYLLEKRMPLQ